MASEEATKQLIFTSIPADTPKDFFQGKELNEADFRGALLGDFNFSDASLIAASFKRAKARSAQFGRKDQPARGVDHRGDLSRADFSNAVIAGARFDCANLTDAKFGNVEGQETRFIGSDLSGAKFREAKLRNADFTSANLADADFSFADLTGATGLHFDHCDVRGAALGPRAADPWTKLIRTYTGAKFSIYLLLFVIFVVCVSLKAFYYTILASQRILTTPSAIYENVSLISLLSGWYFEDFWGRAFLVLGAFYSVFRFLLTMRVMQLRDGADNSGRTPYWLIWRRSPTDGPFTALGNLLSCYGPLVFVHRVLFVIGLITLVSWISPMSRLLLVRVPLPT